MKSFRRCPALYVALLFFLGILSYFFWPLLALPLLLPKKWHILIPLLGFALLKIVHPSFPIEGKGSGIFHIEEVKQHAGPIKQTIVYRGKIKWKSSEGKSYRSLPCRVYFPLRKNRPPATQDFAIKNATLKPLGVGSYMLKGGTWEPIENTSSLAEWRFQLKEKVRRHLHSRFKGRQVATLITALGTGTLESRYLAFHFQRVGLSHLLAISGFHFALLTFFLSLLLKRLFSERVMALILIGLLSTYFFYMGSAPSISRAWIGVILYLIGLVFAFRPHPLNALGVALLAALLFDPLIVTNIGFQLSFGATLGILLFYHRFDVALEFFLPRRPLPLLLQMTWGRQTATILCFYLRKVLALQGAVLTFTLPLILFHFGKYPLLALPFNLFYPLLFTLLVALALLPLDFLTSLYANFLLDLVIYAPKKLTLFLTPLPFAAIVGGLVIFLAHNKLLWQWRVRRKK